MPANVAEACVNISNACYHTWCSSKMEQAQQKSKVETHCVQYCLSNLKLKGQFCVTRAAQA